MPIITAAVDIEFLSFETVIINSNAVKADIRTAGTKKLCPTVKTNTVSKMLTPNRINPINSKIGFLTLLSFLTFFSNSFIFFVGADFRDSLKLDSLVRGITPGVNASLFIGQIINRKSIMKTIFNFFA